MTPEIKLRFIIGITLLIAGSPDALGAVRPTKLKCEYHTNPLGLDVRLPRLSWILAADRRAERQTAYQVLAASSPEMLKADRGDLWDSGRIASDQSVHVLYVDNALGSGQRAWWKVRVWDRDGKASGWSAPAWWEMGLLAPQDWKAQWIGRAPEADSQANEVADVKWIWYPEGDPRQDAPAASRYFRLTFDVPAGKTIKQAVLALAADNEFSASVNGRNVGSGGGWQAFHIMDIARRLHPGRNLVAVQATNSGGPAGLAGLVKIAYTDGSAQRLVTGPGWKTAVASAARWNMTDFDDSGWKEALTVANMGDAPWGKVGLSGQSDPNPYLRKTFQARKLIRQARVYATALGLYTFYLNGTRSGDPTGSRAAG